MVPVPDDCKRILTFGAKDYGLYLTYINKEGKILQTRYSVKGTKYSSHLTYELEGTYDSELKPKK